MLGKMLKYIVIYMSEHDVQLVTVTATVVFMCCTVVCQTTRSVFFKRNDIFTLAIKLTRISWQCAQKSTSILFIYGVGTKPHRNSNNESSVGRPRAMVLCSRGLGSNVKQDVQRA